MTTTDHAQEAVGALIKSREWLEDEEFARADLAVKRAQVHATLAVAHELKTANLIAWLELRSPSGIPLSLIDTLQHVNARLGLDGGADS